MKMQDHTNPFIYGRFVSGDEFVGREFELQSVISRLCNRESVAIVGEPHIGKTSFLYKLDDELNNLPQIRSHKWLVRYLDMQQYGDEFTPNDFWEIVISYLSKIGERELNGYIKVATQNSFSRSSDIEDVFHHMHSNGNRLILMLDEFDHLFSLPKFQNKAFYGLLRSISSRVGLSVVIASRMSLAQMNEKWRGMGGMTSPAFNHLDEHHLKLMEQEELYKIISQGKAKFSENDCKFVMTISGGHPYLLQAICSTLYETPLDDQRPSVAAEIFYKRIFHHFQDLWNYLGENTKTVATVLSLVELGGKAFNQDFAFGEIENAQAFELELKELAQNGLAYKIDNRWSVDLENALIWRGQKWKIGTPVFAWWIRDVVIAKNRQIPSVEKWLAKHQYRFFLPKGWWDQIVAKTAHIPGWATKGIGSLARDLYDGLVRK